MHDILGNLKRGKTCGDDGLVAEMLKTGSEDLVWAMAVLFTDLLNRRAEMPAEWRKSRLVVLFKAGDRRLPKNYRPIAILPVLCKVYGAVLLRPEALYRALRRRDAAT